MDVVPVGRHALLVECADAADVPATYAVLRAHAEELGATDVVPAARTVLVDGLEDVVRARALIATLDAAATAHEAALPQDVVEIPVTYDGPDLDEVARQWDLTTGEVVTLHRGTEFVVQFCGFTPGFAYCTGLPDGLVVARRAEPRASVPAGSVALAGGYTSVYPGASPGGWQLIGTTTTALWRPQEPEPTLLQPGNRVRFV